MMRTSDDHEGEQHRTSSPNIELPTTNPVGFETICGRYLQEQGKVSPAATDSKQQEARVGTG